jgi:O-antigen/teichoic acid export membrane protein
LGIPTAGLQTVFAQQAAAAVTDAQIHQLRRTTRSVMVALFLGWMLMAVAIFAFQRPILGLLKINNATALWMTLLVVLASLWLPVMRGILQGQQNFMAFGWAAILDGVGRFIAICIIVLAFKGQAAGAMGAALLGQFGTLAVCLWWTRDILKGTGSSFHWHEWFGRLTPLTLGFGALLFIQNADVIYVQSIFSKQESPFYMAPAVIGFALVQFTGPLVAVMFPKIVRSVARSETTDALKLTFATTVVVGGLAAFTCTIFPELPIRILYFTKPDFLKSAPLVPWFVWCMLFTTLANVLIGNLLARQKFSIVPWLVVITVAYGITLFFLKDTLKPMPAFDAFKRIVQTIGIFNFALLVVAAWFTWHKRQPTPISTEKVVAAR